MFNGTYEQNVINSTDTENTDTEHTDTSGTDQQETDAPDVYKDDCGTINYDDGTITAPYGCIYSPLNGPASDTFFFMFFNETQPLLIL